MMMALAGLARYGLQSRRIAIECGRFFLSTRNMRILENETVRTGGLDVGSLNLALPLVSDANDSRFLCRTLHLYLVAAAVDCGDVALGPLWQDAEEDIPIELSVRVPSLFYLVSRQVLSEPPVVLDLRPSPLYRELWPPLVDRPSLKCFRLETLLLTSEQLLHEVHADMVKVREASTVLSEEN